MNPGALTMQRFLMLLVVVSLSKHWRLLQNYRITTHFE